MDVVLAAAARARRRVAAMTPARQRRQRGEVAVGNRQIRRPLRLLTVNDRSPLLRLDHRRVTRNGHRLVERAELDVSVPTPRDRPG